MNKPYAAPNRNASLNRSARLALPGDVIEKLRQELARLARSKSPDVNRFVRAMHSRYPDLHS